MNAVFSILLLAAILGFIVFLLSKKDQNRRSQYGPSGLSEFRTSATESRFLCLPYPFGACRRRNLSAASVGL